MAPWVVAVLLAEALESALVEAVVAVLESALVEVVAVAPERTPVVDVVV